MKHGLFLRVTLFTLCVLLTTLVLTGALTLHSYKEQVTGNTSQTLITASRVFEQMLLDRSNQLIDKAAALARDPDMLRAVATADLPAAESELTQQGSRAGSDIASWIDSDGNLQATMLNDSADQVDIPYTAIVSSRFSTGKAGLLHAGANLYQFVLTPIQHPMGGWLLMGWTLDAGILREQRQLTGAELSLVLSEDQSADRILATTLDAPDRSALESLATGTLPVHSVTAPVRLQANFLTTVVDLTDTYDHSLRAVLQVSLHEAYADYRNAQIYLFLLGLMTVLAAVTGAFVFSQRLTGTIAAIQEASEHIGNGIYQFPLTVQSVDEINELAESIDTMRKRISEREERIVYRSQHDMLTGLANRTVLDDRIEMSVARASREKKRSAMVALNIRRFKEINDTMGQQAGDQVLVSIADRMRHQLRATDTVLRLGGDDFLALLESGTEEDLLGVVQGLIDKLTSRMRVMDMDIRVNIMVGVAFFPEHGDTADSLLRRTEIALNLAREKNQTLHIYELGEDESHLRRIQIIADLPDAINSSKMFMVYQPKVSVADRKAKHFEALVRWVHPEYGFISPDEFVMLAEQSGNVRSLTHFVIRTVVRQVHDWAESGMDLNVAINLSALDLLDPSLPDVVAAYMRTYKVDANRFTFEITESALMEEPELSIRVLHELKGHRLGLSIDDFGTGYSSLSQLKRLPVNELKIDKSFIMEIQPGTEDAAIVRSTIELGHNLGLKVIAEGVENEDAWDLLSSFGCDYVQGYLISRPMKTEELELWWHEQKAQS